MRSVTLDLVQPPVPATGTKASQTTRYITPDEISGPRILPLPRLLAASTVFKPVRRHELYSLAGECPSTVDFVMSFLLCTSRSSRRQFP